MCGIFAYWGNGNAFDIVMKGVSKLDYRGYDSWGIAYFDDNNGLGCIKDVGMVSSFSGESVQSSAAMGHTRWATHGSVTKDNAHPHFSNDLGIGVVHNGIIENFSELKDFLSSKGYFFRSETDTEVVPNLIDYFMKSMDFEEAVRKAVSMLEGSFALVVMRKGIDELVAVRKMSPLVIGIGNNVAFASSDITAFLEHTRDAVFLDDNEMAFIGRKVRVINFIEGSEVNKRPERLSVDFCEAKKEGFEHFLLKEICEQDSAILRALNQPENCFEGASKLIRDAYGVFFVACGTSYHACLSASYLFSKIFKMHVNVVLASEFSLYRDFLTDRTLIVAVSQSGETADLLDAVRCAKGKKAKVFSVVNVPGSSLVKASDSCIMMNAGHEVSVLSTKSYTSQAVILSLLAYTCAGMKNRAFRLAEEAAAYAKKAVALNSRIEGLAERLKDSRSVFLIGRGTAFPIALEGALKIKEVSYIHAEGLAGGELKHGTLALIEEGVPVIVVANDETRKDIINNALEIKSRGGYIIGIDSKENKVYDFFIEVPEIEAMDAVTRIIPLQMLAYFLAVKRGCNPDRPRNLAKSVTVK